MLASIAIAGNQLRPRWRETRHQSVVRDQNTIDKSARARSTMSIDSRSLCSDIFQNLCTSTVRQLGGS
jgi:hypothetical protein